MHIDGLAPEKTVVHQSGQNLISRIPGKEIGSKIKIVLLKVCEVIDPETKMNQGNEKENSRFVFEIFFRNEKASDQYQRKEDKHGKTVIGEIKHVRYRRNKTVND